MDKLRQRAKRRRHMERERLIAEENKQLADEFNERCKKLGIYHGFKPKQVRRAVDKIKKDSIRTAIMADTIAILWVMRTQYGYGSRRLFRLAGEIMLRITWVGAGERSIDQLNDELKLDAKLDCSAYWTEEAEIDKTVNRAEQQRRNTALTTAPMMFPMPMHAVFYELFKQPLTRKSAQLDKIARLASSAAREAIMYGTLDKLQAELNKCGFYIDTDGKFGGKDVLPEDYQKYRHQLKI